MKQMDDIKRFLNIKVKRIMAGYKSNYNRNINNARSKNERNALVNARDKFLSNKEKEIVKQVCLDVTNWINEHK